MFLKAAGEIFMKEDGTLASKSKDKTLSEMEVLRTIS
jgi:hypothetical protein